MKEFAIGGVQVNGQGPVHAVPGKLRLFSAFRLHQACSIVEDGQLRVAQAFHQRARDENRRLIVAPHEIGGPAAEHQPFGKTLMLAKGKARDHEVVEPELRRALTHQVQDFIFGLYGHTAHAAKEISMGVILQDRLFRVSHIGHQSSGRRPYQERKGWGPAVSKDRTTRQGPKTTEVVGRNQGKIC